jgi:glycerol-3-phosphate acyltransferase PlsY
MGYFAVILVGYLLGSSNLAYWLSRVRHVDMTTKGTKNLGASNATVLLGWRAGVAVAVHDIGKAVIAVLLAKLLFPMLPYAPAAAGVAAVLGHIFPFYLKFRGGKGLASFLGLTLGLNWKLALAVCVILVVVTLVTDYIVLGTVCVTVSMPIGLFLMTGSLIMVLVVCVASAVILYKHRENYVRIWNRTEIGLRVTIKGENKIK